MVRELMLEYVGKNARKKKKVFDKYMLRNHEEDIMTKLKVLSICLKKRFT